MGWWGCSDNKYSLANFVINIENAINFRQEPRITIVFHKRLINSPPLSARKAIFCILSSSVFLALTRISLVLDSLLGCQILAQALASQVLVSAFHHHYLCRWLGVPGNGLALVITKRLGLYLIHVLQLKHPGGLCTLNIHVVGFK